jgi:far upstream element-binding protein
MTRMLESPKHMIGRVIGRGGETVKQLQKHFNVNVQIEQVCGSSL